MALRGEGPGAPHPQGARSCAHPALPTRGGGLGSLPPSLSLVVAVDVRDPPDILQVKAHPRQLGLLPTSYVLACNTAPRLSASRAGGQEGGGAGDKECRTESRRASPG